MSSHLPSLFFLLLSISQCCSFVPVSQPQSTTFVLAASHDNNRLAYIIDPIGEDPNEQIFADIADMCTDVFYKDGQMHAKPEDTLV
jgi:signal transduction protein with GAF and PtsI domain